MASNNAINLSQTGIVTADGSGSFTGSSVTQHGVLVGGASNAVASTAVGNSGQIMTSNGAGVAPTFQTLSGVGGLVFLASGTASTSATLDFTGIDSTYNMYVFIIEDVLPDTNNTRLHINTSTNGGSSYDTGATDYVYNGWYYTTSTFTNNGGGSTAAALQLTINHGNVSDEQGSGIVYCWNPSSTTETKFMWDVIFKEINGIQRQSHGMGVRDSAADVDAVRFIFNAGNIASGTIYMYGMTEPS